MHFPEWKMNKSVPKTRNSTGKFSLHAFSFLKNYYNLTFFQVQFLDYENNYCFTFFYIGPYVKWFMKKIGPEGIYKMLQAWEDKTAYTLATIGYSDGSIDEEGNPNVVLFEGKEWGNIVKPSQPSKHFHNSCFIPNGSDKGARVQAVEMLKEYLMKEIK